MTLGKGKIWKYNKNNVVLNDDIIKNNIKNNAGIIILIMWLILKILLKSKDVLYQVSSDLDEVNSFYSSFCDASQKSPSPFKSSKKPALYRVNSLSTPFLSLISVRNKLYCRRMSISNSSSLVLSHINLGQILMHVHNNQ